MSDISSIAEKISNTNFSSKKVLVVGYGPIGREYVSILKTLNVARIDVCTSTDRSLRELKQDEQIRVFSGGYSALSLDPDVDDTAILATPMDVLLPAARHTMKLGFKKILVEKPISLFSTDIEQLAKEAEERGVLMMCAYNRVGFSSLLQARYLANQEGGVTSCHYDCSEIVKPDWVDRFSVNDLARWGVANSIHVLSMAHALIGLPEKWTSYQHGKQYPWHPTGDTFVGSGVSQKNIPFAFHANWSSRGRWMVEFHTRSSSYRMCPLEKLYFKNNPMDAYSEVPLRAANPNHKPGFLEQVASILDPGIRDLIPLMSIQASAKLTRYAEDVFGYKHTRG